MIEQGFNKRVYVVHGYGASPTRHWFPWLKESLSKQEIACKVLRMPDSSDPDPEAWIGHLSDNIEAPDEDTFFVGHSLGCVTLLKYLHRAKRDGQIGGLVLVSGFVQALPNLPELDTFVTGELDYPQIVGLSEHRVVIASKNDETVPLSYSRELADKIHAEFFEAENGGHFLDIEGFTTLPVVYEALSSMLGPGIRNASEY